MLARAVFYILDLLARLGKPGLDGHALREHFFQFFFEFNNRRIALPQHRGQFVATVNQLLALFTHARQ